MAYASQINNNEFRHNQSFSQAKSVQGGGPGGGGRRRPGPQQRRHHAGHRLGQTILSNTFEGNLAGAGDSGGIALVGVNGTNDVVALGKSVPVLGTASTSRNNVIVDNGAGRRGRRHPLQDAINVNIVNNTVAFNDSYATAARAVPGRPDADRRGQLRQRHEYRPGVHPAHRAIGDAERRGHHRLRQLARAAAAIRRPGRGQSQLLAGNSRWISDATLVNDGVPVTAATTGASTTARTRPPARIQHQRHFSLIGLEPQTAGNDIAVLFPPAGATPRLEPELLGVHGANVADGTTGSNNPRRCQRRLPQPYALAATVRWRSRSTLSRRWCSGTGAGSAGADGMTTAAAFDEGGNFIDVRFGPLTRGLTSRPPAIATVCRCAGLGMVRLRQLQAASLWRQPATGNPLVGLQW